MDRVSTVAAGGSVPAAPGGGVPAAAGGGVPTPLSEPLVFAVYTGLRLDSPGSEDVPAAARLGLEPPRYCGQCGRRMIVQVVPDGWTARCSRHGSVDSASIGPR